jgi:hypothetical protein
MSDVLDETIAGEVVIAGTEFNYAELKFGKSRGIDIYRPGFKDDKHSYKLDPNPHDDSPWYEKNTVRFYRDAAEQLGAYFNANNVYPPFNTTITVHNTVYTLTER